MGNSPQSGFLTTPAFELFRRGLTVQTIKKFHGLNIFAAETTVGADFATDLLNVIVGADGKLSKMRTPIKLSPAVTINGVIQNTGPQAFWDFQQAIGTRQVLAQFGASMVFFTNDLAVANLIETNILNLPRYSTVEANNILFAANGQRDQKWTGTAWQQWGINFPTVAPVLGPQTAGGLSPAVGYVWAFAWKNSITGAVSNITPVSASTGAVAAKQFQVNATASPDPQVDTIVWFRNLDGGGDYFRLAEVFIPTNTVTFNAATVSVVAGSSGLDIVDNTPDANLDLTIRGPLINNPPPLGTYLAVAQGRVFIAGLAGAPSDMVYSGLEQIVYGRPEESFPTFNRIHIQVGAETISGLGTLHRGVVVFSNTGKMWILRGAIEDITLNNPPSFSDVLEELPWNLGCLSHYTIQSTPYGLVWLAGDKTVQFWDGHSPPQDISESVYPILRTITPGTEALSNATFFNWLERDWYCLSCCTNGAASPNTLIFWSLDPQTQNIEVFLSTIPADYINIISTSKLQRKLIISGGGFLSELPVKATDLGGLTNDFATYPPTNTNLRAYWRSCFFGNDNPEVSKMWRWTRIIPDRGSTSYQIQARYVDDNNTIDVPRIVGPTPLTTPRTGLNQRAYRCSIEIDFPEQDLPANVLEMQVAFVGTSQR